MRAGDGCILVHIGARLLWEGARERCCVNFIGQGGVIGWHSGGVGHDDSTATSLDRWEGQDIYHVILMHVDRWEGIVSNHMI